MKCRFRDRGSGQTTCRNISCTRRVKPGRARTDLLHVRVLARSLTRSFLLSLCPPLVRLRNMPTHSCSRAGVHCFPFIELLVSGRSWGCHGAGVQYYVYYPSDVCQNLKIFLLKAPTRPESIPLYLSVRTEKETGSILVQHTLSREKFFRDVPQIRQPAFRPKSTLSANARKLF